MDAKLKSLMSSMRAVAEIYYDDNGGVYAKSPYDANSCSSGFTSDATGNGKYYISELSSFSSIACRYQPNSPQAYAISATMSSYSGPNNGIGNDVWCIDSTGRAGIVPEILPQNVYSCSISPI